MSEDIIRMAREAGARLDKHNGGFIDQSVLLRFAALVAAAEREACAKLIDSRKTGANKLMDAVRDMEARAIRARGQA